MSCNMLWFLFMVHELKIFQSLVVLQRHTASITSFTVSVFMSASQFDQVFCRVEAEAGY